MKLRFVTMIGFLVAVVILSSCSKTEPVPPPPAPASPYTKVIFKLIPTVNGVTVTPSDSIIYENLSGNIYSVKNFKILISDIRLEDWYYNHYQIGEYHLFDINEPSSMVFSPKDTIREFNVSSVSLFLGFNEASNITGKYPDLDNKVPTWGWKPIYGGGYQLMYMDGKFYSDGLDGTPDPYTLSIGGKRLVVTPQDSSYKPNQIVASITHSRIEFPVGDADIKYMYIELRIDLNKLFQSSQAFANFNLDQYNSGLETDAAGSAILSTNLFHPWTLGSVTFNALPN